MSVINVRFNGKPSTRKLRSFLPKLTPRFLSLPGKVIVFPRGPYTFRRNKKSVEQANLIGKMLRCERESLVNSIASSRDDGKKRLIGGVSLEVPDSILINKNLQFKVNSLVMCTECGTPVPFSPALFGPWDGMWCGSCIHPLGINHRTKYCANCHARVIASFPKGKKSLRTDVVWSRHRVKRRGRNNTKGSAFRDWYNLLGRTYKVIDHRSMQWYEINLCDPCVYTCDFFKVEQKEIPHVLGSLMNALKNPYRKQVSV